METIIVKPKDAQEAKEVLDFLKKNNIHKEIYKERTKKEILDSIERGAKQAADFINGKIQLKDAQQILDDL